MAMGVSDLRPRLYGGRGYKPMSQINVTPFVDVMLVLLVVFMVTAPLLTVGVEVDLPEGDAPVLEGQDEPLEITVDSAGQVFVQETVVALNELAPKLVAITNRKADTRIFVRGDRTIDYGRVMAVMATVNAAGFSRVALVMEIPPPAGAK